MQMSKRAKRMAKRNARGRKQVALNLVSLMDIFTILVFFLLVNSTDVEVLPNARDVQLPESVAEEKARENVVVLVTGEQILVQGQPVASVAEVMDSEAIVIPALRDALTQQTDRVLRKQAMADVAAREVTIMGDRALPYRLLKRVMATCTAADYGRISLAVLQRPLRQAAADAAAGEPQG
ncbi:MAG: biopolymer transporter ExbD [Gammaproteobacteria bacterium]|nr:MAG: biopolymer transporter ExbD [Gammaproteobacteria bacterium]